MRTEALLLQKPEDSHRIVLLLPPLVIVMTVNTATGLKSGEKEGGGKGGTALVVSILLRIHPVSLSILVSGDAVTSVKMKWVSPVSLQAGLDLPRSRKVGGQAREPFMRSGLLENEFH